jgi:predicted enzyme related to lactoylglutathione lyase
MNAVQIEQKSYEMPPREGFTVAHFLTVADVDRSTRFYEKVFGGRILSRGDSEGAPACVHSDREYVAPSQCRGRADSRQADGNPQRPRP